MGASKPLVDVTETAFGLEYSVHGALRFRALQPRCSSASCPPSPVARSLSTAAPGRD